jgi:death-on-curing protein
LGKKEQLERARSRPGQGIAFLEASDVITIHEQLTKEFFTTEDPISPPGVRDFGLLESAVSRQHTAARDIMKYATPARNAAALMYGLCNNHPFFNGYKRAALVAMLLHLDRNHLVLQNVTREDLFRLMKRVASHFYSSRTLGKDVLPDPDREIDAIASWLNDNSRHIKKGERPISYGELYRIIEQFGFKMGAKRHNYIEVLARKTNWLGRERWECVYKVPCPGDSRTATVNDIKNARRALNLQEEDGVDSESFYDTRTVIDSFITVHRQVLRKLART